MSYKTFVMLVTGCEIMHWVVNNDVKSSEQRGNLCE
jgi:hypothetical protein